MRYVRATTAASEPRPGSAATFRFRTIEFVCRPDAMDECDAAIDGLIAHAGASEEGTRFVACFRDSTDPCRYLLTAVFVDERAERVHDASPAGRRLRDTIRIAAEDGLRLRWWEPEAGL